MIVSVCLSVFPGIVPLVLKMSAAIEVVTLGKELPSLAVGVPLMTVSVDVQCTVVAAGTVPGVVSDVAAVGGGVDVAGGVAGDAVGHVAAVCFV